jgi:hypothetical protein
MTSFHSSVTPALHLLPNEADALENLLGSRRRGVQAASQRCILVLQLRDTILEFALGLGGRHRALLLELLEPRLREQCTPAKAGELVAHMANEQLKLAKGGYFRSNAV